MNKARLSKAVLSRALGVLDRSPFRVDDDLVDGVGAITTLIRCLNELIDKGFDLHSLVLLHELIDVLQLEHLSLSLLQVLVRSLSKNGQDLICQVVTQVNQLLVGISVISQAFQCLRTDQRDYVSEVRPD